MGSVNGDLSFVTSRVSVPPDAFFRQPKKNIDCEQLDHRKLSLQPHRLRGKKQDLYLKANSCHHRAQSSQTSQLHPPAGASHFANLCIHTIYVFAILYISYTYSAPPCPCRTYGSFSCVSAPSMIQHLAPASMSWRPLFIAPSPQKSSD